MTAFPFIIVRKNRSTVATINHERIHHRQQIEIGIVGLTVVMFTTGLGYSYWWLLLILSFYPLYVLEWFVRLYSIIQMGDFITINGKNYFPVKMKVSSDGISKVMAFEASLNRISHGIEKTLTNG